MLGGSLVECVLGHLKSQKEKRFIIWPDAAGNIVSNFENTPLGNHMQ